MILSWLRVRVRVLTVLAVLSGSPLLPIGTAADTTTLRGHSQSQYPPRGLMMKTRHGKGDYGRVDDGDEAMGGHHGKGMRKGVKQPSSEMTVKAPSSMHTTPASMGMHMKVQHNGTPSKTENTSASAGVLKKVMRGKGKGATETEMPMMAKMKHRTKAGGTSPSDKGGGSTKSSKASKAAKEGNGMKSMKMKHMRGKGKGKGNDKQTPRPTLSPTTPKEEPDPTEAPTVEPPMDTESPTMEPTELTSTDVPTLTPVDPSTDAPTTSPNETVPPEPDTSSPTMSPVTDSPTIGPTTAAPSLPEFNITCGGCPDCPDVLTEFADGVSCGTRIEFAQTPLGGGFTEIGACGLVATTFPEVCGPCDPATCTVEEPPCGCETCTPEVLQRDASGVTCEVRIDFLQTPEGGNLSESQACSIVAADHPESCGPCSPCR